MNSGTLVSRIIYLSADNGFDVFVGVEVEHSPDLGFGFAVDLVVGQERIDLQPVAARLGGRRGTQPDHLSVPHLPQVLDRLLQPVRRPRIKHRRQITRHFQPVINMSQHDFPTPQDNF